MRDPLTIAAAQPRLVSHDVTANALAHAQAVREADARVVVFPELSLTGYELDADPVSCDDPRLEPLAHACADTGTLALAGAPVADDSDVHIAMLAVTGDSVSVAYRKMWLGPAEEVRFTPGSKPAVVEVDGWRLGLAICKDTGHPQHAADTAALGIDAYVAAILHAAGEADVHGQRALRVAADHGVWVVVASFAGSTGGGYTHAAGRSGIWGPDGGLVAEAGTAPGYIVRASLR